MLSTIRQPIYLETEGITSPCGFQINPHTPAGNRIFLMFKIGASMELEREKGKNLIEFVEMRNV
jgi:hypothetical protein